MDTQFRTAYGPKLKVAVQCNDKSRTKQAMKDECDINKIVKQFDRTGLVEHRNSYEGNYGEFIALDFREAMQAVVEAEEMFMTLPADVRKRFSNDPGEFLEFVKDEKNEQAMVDLGLATAAQLSDTDRIVNALESLGSAEGDGSAVGGGEQTTDQGEGVSGDG